MIAAEADAHGIAGEQKLASALDDRRRADLVAVDMPGNGYLFDHGASVCQRAKRTPAILGSVSMVVLIGFWLERNVLIWPSLVPESTMAFAGWIQLGVAAGFTGAFALVILLFTRVFPALPVPDRS